ncbi:unnamed protein product [Psylliodes chrysocephalus]|uniref:Gag-like protein n=1 Tax=Psylliodes chrysocephalus TaxID=3402493 RepID=A0A9P0CY76_9CUCU|nr:unnamed protein product [Psylliodes chrysocephala]
MGEPSGASKKSGKPTYIATEAAKTECDHSKHLSNRVKAYNKLIQESRENYIRNPNITKPRRRIILSGAIKSVSTESLSSNLGENTKTPGESTPKFSSLKSMEKTNRRLSSSQTVHPNTDKQTQINQAQHSAAREECSSKSDTQESMQKAPSAEQTQESKENAFYLLSQADEMDKTKVNEDVEMTDNMSDHSQNGRNSAHTDENADLSDPKGPKTDSEESSENSYADRYSSSDHDTKRSRRYLQSTEKEDSQTSDNRLSESMENRVWESMENSKHWESMEKSNLESMENTNRLQSMEKDKNLQSMEKAKNLQSLEKNKNSDETPVNKRRNEIDNFVSEYISIPAAEGLKITIKQSDVPQALKRNIMDFNSDSESAERTPLLKQNIIVPLIHNPPPQPKEMSLPDGRTQPLPSKQVAYKPKPKPDPKPEDKRKPNEEIINTSPNSTFPLQRAKKTRKPTEDTDMIETYPQTQPMDTHDANNEFISPPKISGHLKRVMKQKVIASLPKPVETKNRFQVLTESEEEDEQIMEERLKARKERREKAENYKKSLAEKPTVKPPSKDKNEPPQKKKSAMPPIVLEGVPEDHKGLTGVLREIIKGNFNVKYTNNSTIVFTEDKSDYDRILENIKTEEMAFHTYTSKSDKSHAFVLRGLGDGTKIEDLEEDLMINYEIKTRAIYRMTTRNRPLYLVVTDPSITMEYLNRNVKVVLYTRITWELRRSTKLIIQCHNCQAWGHATSNCGRLPNCLKCAAGHHTKTCLKSRDTPATCVNCGGDHPANFTKCKSYLDRVARLEERKMTTNNKKSYKPAPLPTHNRWESRKEATKSSKYNTEFPLLPGNRDVEFPLLPGNRDVPQQEQRRQPSRPTQQTQGGMDDIFALNHEMQELNSLVNIAELTRAVRELNSKLRECRSESQIFLTYNSFMSNLNSYSFRN